MIKHSFRCAALAGAVLLIGATLVPPAARADDDATPATAGTGVAWMRYLNGDVSIQRGDASDAFAAALNAPLLGGDYVSTAGGSDADVAFDRTTHIRLASDTQLHLSRVDTGDRVVQLAAGTIELRVRGGTSRESSEIDTPSIAVSPQSDGAYRVTVTPDGTTLVTVRQGTAGISSPQGSQDVGAGTTLTARGNADSPSIDVGEAIAYDEFDAFNRDRDARETPRPADTAYVNGDVGGVDELDGYGRWVDDSSYGHVWIPAETGPDWAPYRDGRWVWEEGYGWTWVGAEPWGWAPYHYGSWYHSPSYGWAWCPPQPQVVVPWRPALVAFIGFGGGGGVGFGFGNVGWVPLAPYEPYHPWLGNRYGGGPTIVNNNITNITNITNVTNVTTVYKNVRYNGVTATDSRRFIEGNFAHNVAVAPHELQNARAFRGALPVVPTAAHLRFTQAAPIAAHAAASVFAARTFAGTTPAVRRTSFVEQRVSFARAANLPLPPSSGRANAVSSERAPVVHPNTAAGFASSRPATAAGIQRPAATPAGADRIAAPAGGERPSAVRSDAWSRFNERRAGTTAPNVRSAAGSATAPGRRNAERTDAPHPVEYIAPSSAASNAPPHRIDHGAAGASRTYAAPPRTTTYGRSGDASYGTTPPAVRTPADGRAPSYAHPSTYGRASGDHALSPAHLPSYDRMSSEVRATTPRAPSYARTASDAQPRRQVPADAGQPEHHAASHDAPKHPAESEQPHVHRR